MKRWSLDARSGERNRLIPLFKGEGKKKHHSTVQWGNQSAHDLKE
jgi:hypothetical protein